MRVTKYVFTICLLLLCILFANGIYALLEPADGWHSPAPITTEQTGINLLEHEYSHSESSTSEEKPLNLLVLGLDRDGTRCDVIMLFNFEPNLSKLNILSIARDTRVRKNGKYSKINALYSKGEEKMVAEKVTEITGLPVHYYITMDFRGFRELVDTLGGVEFYVPFRMNYDDPTQNLHIHLKKGRQLLDGVKAEQLVRYRKGNYSGQGYSEGDIGRIGMQQDFIKALIEQKLSIRYISRADELFYIMKEYVHTNLAISDITHYLGSASKIKSSETGTYTLPGDSQLIGDAWYYIHNSKETAGMISNHFYR